MRHYKMQQLVILYKTYESNLKVFNHFCDYGRDLTKVNKFGLIRGSFKVVRLGDKLGHGEFHLKKGNSLEIRPLSNTPCLVANGSLLRFTSEFEHSLN